jgi:hypothetical protein
LGHGSGVVIDAWLPDHAEHVGMERTTLRRLAAPAAILASIGQFVVAMVIPYWNDPDPVAGMGAILADTRFWAAVWLIHVAGIVLIVLTLAIATRTFTSGAAHEWVQVGLPIVAMGGALGLAETLTGASLSHVAEAWAAAPAADQSGYVAAYGAVGQAAIAMDFGAIICVALYLPMLGAAILVGHTYAHWIGWAFVVSGTMFLVGILAELAIPEAGLLNFIAQLVFTPALIGLGVSVGRLASRLPDAATSSASVGVDAAASA